MAFNELEFANKVALLKEELGFTNISHLEEKEKIGEEIASKVKGGEKIGFGSGSTAFLAAIAIAKKVKKNNISISCIPTSLEISHLIASLGLPLGELNEVELDFCFDGADEVDAKGRLIKGRGAALTKEKIVLSNAKKAYILVDKSKFVSSLGEKFFTPIEVLPSAAYAVKRKLIALGASSLSLRKAGLSKDGPVITENGNFIIDAKFVDVENDLEFRINNIPGVVENGLFLNYPQIEIISL